MRLHNKSTLKPNRKNLRNQSTPAEVALWLCLKNGKLDGHKFRRQHSVGHFILDFYCPAKRLCIELDGAQHYTPDGVAIDTERDAFLQSCQITVLRFENRLIFENPEGLLEEIRQHLK